MRKSADVVILMQLNSNNYTLLYPSQVDWDDFCQVRPDVPFSDVVIEYLNALSASLMTDRESRLYPDVVTFAFFCRKANLLKMKAAYQFEELRQGRGILFHIAPSNVPVNFGYTLVAGLLAGNNNIVRASSKDFPQVNIIVRHLHKLLTEGQYAEVGKRIVLVKYDRTSDATADFSFLANVRVIWGGDQTIATIRQNALPPRAFDVCFADRYSIAVVNPTTVLTADDKEIEQLALNFYNDTYLFDQNACSAPHTVFWLKSGNVEAAQGRFWKTVHQVVEKKYGFQDVMSVDKLTAFYKQAVGMKCHRVCVEDNMIVRTQLDELPYNIDSYRCACGYFSEYDIDSLDEIASIVNVKYQTLAYYGIEKEALRTFMLRNRLMGLDRIVPIGETTSFALTWDGYNLMDTFTRCIAII